VYLQWRTSASSVDPLPPSAPEVSAAGTVGAQRAASVPSLEWEDLFFGRFEARTRDSGGASPARVLFTPSSAADQLWVHWLPTAMGELPADLIAPLAESAYFGPELDTLVTGGEPPATSVPEPFLHPAPTVAPAVRQPEPAAPPAPPAPPLSKHADSGTIPPAKLPASQTAPTPPPTPHVAPSCEVEPPKWMRSILAEAMNPIPPHLRSASDDSMPSAVSAPAGGTAREFSPSLGFA
jgi:hypothetical protein